MFYLKEWFVYGKVLILSKIFRHMIRTGFTAELEGGIFVYVLSLINWPVCFFVYSVVSHNFDREGEL